jgi:hypothetical protein
LGRREENKTRINEIDFAFLCLDEKIKHLGVDFTNLQFGRVYVPTNVICIFTDSIVLMNYVQIS